MSDYISNGILNVTKWLLKIIMYPVGILFLIFLIFFVIVNVWIIYYKKIGVYVPKGYRKKIKKTGFFTNLFILAPKRYALDIANRPDGFFKPCGLIIYEGRQGAGKTNTMIRDVMLLQEQYTECKVITNCDYKNQDNILDHWMKLIAYKNGYKGVIAVLDELQNWFSSKQSANFPPEMLSVVTQNRKNRRILMGTAQNFYMLSKDIRTQTTEIRRCMTLLGCITIIHRVIPICDSQGEVKEYKNRGWYWYVHGSERDNYDTYRVIESLAKSGFKDMSSTIDNTVINVISADKVMKK